MVRSKKSAASALVLGALSAGLSISAQVENKLNRAPRLVLVPPAELYHSALRPPEVYESTQTNASSQVYLFRQAPPDVVQRFQRTLLREWIAPQYQEGQLSGPPSVRAARIQGADTTVFAQFAEPTYAGMFRPRLRILLVSRGWAAIVDAQAHSAQAWNIFSPSLQALISTLRVETEPESAPITASPASRALAGLYAAVRPKFVSAIGPGVGAGSGGFVQARHFYLFSDDGRVYRAYDGIAIPRNDIRNFDFAEAAVADPVNTGRYTIEGNQLILRMGERLDEVSTVTIRQPGRLLIGSVDYSRQ